MITMINHSLEIQMYDPSLIEEPLDQLMDPNYWKTNNLVEGSATGRNVTWFVRKNNELIMALRHYYRGGLLRFFIRDSYFFFGLHQTRSIKELQLLEQLYQRGINVPRPIAARAVRSGLFYKADILTEKIKEASDLISLLKKNRLSQKIWRDIGYQIARLHEQQVNHVDLNAHNILIDKNNKVWLIDFDKCHIQSFQYWKQWNLNRLKRSLLKEKKKYTILFDEHNWLDLMLGYEHFHEMKER